MKSSNRLAFVGTGLYFSCVALLYAFRTEEQSAEILKPVHQPVLFLLALFLPGLSMSLAWVWTQPKAFFDKLLFVFCSTSLYSLVILAGMDSPLTLLLWIGLGSCTLLLLHHHLLEELQALPTKLLKALLGATLAALPLFTAMQNLLLDDKELIFLGFLSFPAWGWLMGRLVEH